MKPLTYFPDAYFFPPEFSPSGRAYKAVTDTCYGWFTDREKAEQRGHTVVELVLTGPARGMERLVKYRGRVML